MDSHLPGEPAAPEPRKDAKPRHPGEGPGPSRPRPILGLLLKEEALSWGRGTHATAPLPRLVSWWNISWGLRDSACSAPVLPLPPGQVLWSSLCFRHIDVLPLPQRPSLLISWDPLLTSADSPQENSAGRPPTNRTCPGRPWPWGRPAASMPASPTGEEAPAKSPDGSTTDRHATLLRGQQSLFRSASYSKSPPSFSTRQSSIRLKTNSFETRVQF